MTVIRIGTRGSELAMWQANFVRQSLLAAHAEIAVELVPLSTRGDKMVDQSLAEVPGKGLFTKEIEDALLAGHVDLAVHSLKDLPTEIADGMALAAIMKREDPAEALISRDGLTLDQLPHGAKVLTGSPRREAQLLHRRPDVQVLPVRGNVPTRIAKFRRSGADGIILACAGLIRLGLAGQITQRLEPVQFLPACGQGALAVEIRADNGRLADLCAAMEDLRTRLCVTAEREFLAALGGGCQAPIGAYGRFDSPGELTLTGMSAGPDGKGCTTNTTSSVVSDVHSAGRLGRQLAQAMPDRKRTFDAHL